MGRKLMRVPLDFEKQHPIGEVWPGYLVQPAEEIEDDEESERWYEANCYEPPEGPGFQLWETTTEGSPASPVFETLDALCEWAATNATTFADIKASKERWREMLETDSVLTEVETPGGGRMIFL